MPTGIYIREGRVLGKVKAKCKKCGRDIVAHYSRNKKFCNIMCYYDYIRENKIIPANCKNTGRTYVKKGNIPWNKVYEDINERKKLEAHNRRVGNGIKLTIAMIQKVYEDNIKKYGTLTCYYCLKQIMFGKDTLEHKTPVSRGGTNVYDNLAIACHSCNSGKRNRTEKEYRYVKNL